MFFAQCDVGYRGDLEMGMNRQLYQKTVWRAGTSVEGGESGVVEDRIVVYRRQHGQKGYSHSGNSKFGGMLYWCVQHFLTRSLNETDQVGGFKISLERSGEI